MALSAHVEVEGKHPWHEILVEVTELLRDRFGITHLTLQPETCDPGYDAFRGCSLETPARPPSTR